MLRAWLLLNTILVGATLAKPDSKPAVSAINALGVDLLHKEARSGNTVFSPYSIQFALSMTFEGAAGGTREQMVKALHYSGNDMATSFATLNAQLLELADRSSRDARKGDAITLEIANRLYGQAGFPFRATFLDFLRKQHDAPLETLDFAKGPAAARKINEWVATKTRNRIRDLIPADALGSFTRLVLVNAIYLKAPWEEAFGEKATKPQPFHLPGGKSVRAPTMFRQASFGYAKGEGFEAVAIPYVGGELQFLILLPTENEGLPALEGTLRTKLLTGFANLPAAEIALHLPKFKLEPPVIKLNATLQKLGMKSAFDIPPGSANFDGIAPAKGPDALFISDVFHKAFLEIDEKGTEAAAATAVVMKFRALPPPPKRPIEVRVDRPFLFAVQHIPSGACLFLGRVTDPR
jgi:serpin B